jgi:hypothetical protein
LELHIAKHSSSAHVVNVTLVQFSLLCHRSISKKSVETQTPKGFAVPGSSVG